MCLQTVGEDEMMRNEKGLTLAEKCIISLVFAINILSVYLDDAVAEQHLKWPPNHMRSSQSH